MKIALIQVASPESESIEARRERVKRLMRTADGADLIVLPELWAVGYFAFDDYAASAESRNGPTIQDAREVARELNCHVHVGSFIELAGHDRYRNTAALVLPDGEVSHFYSKIHVFGYKSQEVDLLEPGDSIAATPTGFGRIASTTCYDLRFPELWRKLVDIGAESVIVPAAWPSSRREHWQILTTARAIEEQVYVIACNAVGTQKGIPLGGHSRVVSPWGEVIVEAGTEEGVIWCDVDVDLTSEVRQEFPVLADRLDDYDALELLTTGGKA